MKLTTNRVFLGAFALIFTAALVAKAVTHLGHAWSVSMAEAEKKERELARVKAEAEAKQRLTKAAVVEAAEKYEAQKEGLGRYKRPGDGNQFTLDKKDAYGKPLRLIYARGAVVDSFKVRSAGPDGTFYTEDDVVEEKWTANGAGAVDAAANSASDLLNKAKSSIFGGKKDDR